MGADAPKDLEEVQNLTLPELRSVTSVAISGDGKFLYAAAFNAGTVTTFTRDVQTGLLEFDDVISGPALAAAVSVCLSADGKYALACAFGANTVTLFKRDAATGRLSVQDGAFEGQPGVKGVNFVIDAGFSPDNQFVYTASSGGVGVFKLGEEKLSFVQFQEADGRLKGVRGITMSPNGEWLYAPAYQSGTLGVMRRDTATGRLETVQILANGENGVNALNGAFRAATSSDGKHVYVSSGRFRGDQAISAFEVQEDGKFKMLQEFVNGMEGFDQFKGGNSIKVSPDGKSVFALASVSDRLFRFQREPGSGKLAFAGSQQVGKEASPGSAGLCFSPDGKFAYVADEAASAIVAFRMP